MLPLYAHIPRDSFEQATSAHTGLLFDKFPDGWNERQHYQLADNVKKDFLTNCIKKYSKTELELTLTQNLTSALARQRDLVNHLQGESLTVHTDWRFISGLGTAHPYETGFIWHRTLSVPYLSGSSVKGLMRAWAKQWCESDIQQQVTHLFGTEKTTDKVEQDHCGALIIFDALPTKPPTLEIDILNPHYSEYYQDSKNPPADYLSPIPVFFLTVAAGQEFEFFLAPRSEKAQQDEDLKTGLKLLKDALKTLGAGGKTAVGYGAFTFKESKNAQKKCGAEFRAEQAAEAERERLKIKILENLNPLERELKEELENFLNNVPEQEQDTRLLRELEEGNRWTGEKAKLVAEKIKQLMETTGKWCPEFTGTNKQKLKLKERSLKVQTFLE